MKIEQQQPFSPEESLLEARVNGFLTEEDYFRWVSAVHEADDQLKMLARLLKETAITMIYDPKHISDKETVVINGKCYGKCLCKDCTLARIGVETYGLL